MVQRAVLLTLRKSYLQRGIECFAAIAQLHKRKEAKVRAVFNGRNALFKWGAGETRNFVTERNSPS